jgi:L-rhamnose isomerase
MPTCPEKAVFFVGSFFSDGEVFSHVEQILRDKFGEVLYRSPLMSWNYSDYYNQELGVPLCRNFIFFQTVIDPSRLAEAKIITKGIEEIFSRERRRRINLDPGYMTLAKVVLASKKNYSHRIYIGKGVYAELELFYSGGVFNPLPYTYSDYREKAYLDIFSRARKILKAYLHTFS